MTDRAKLADEIEQRVANRFGDKVLYADEVLPAPEEPTIPSREG